jgi:hypothetical protein
VPTQGLFRSRSAGKPSAHEVSRPYRDGEVTAPGQPSDSYLSNNISKFVKKNYFEKKNKLGILQISLKNPSQK